MPKGETNIFQLRTTHWFMGYASANQIHLLFGTFAQKNGSNPALARRMELGGVDLAPVPGQQHDGRLYVGAPGWPGGGHQLLARIVHDHYLVPLLLSQGEHHRPIAYWSLNRHLAAEDDSLKG